MGSSRIARVAALCLLASIPTAGSPAGAAEPTAPEVKPLPRVLLLGLFHFHNPGLDAVKFEPIDVMAAEQQAYLVALAGRLASFAPTRVLLEYPQKSDEAMNQRYADYLAGRFELGRNEIYQLGFRVARLMGHERVYGIDAQAPRGGTGLWDYLAERPEMQQDLERLIAAESERLQRMHRALSLGEILALSNSVEEDRRNKGFYMYLNPVAAGSGLFLGADDAAAWWHRNLRMYALIQEQAQPGERVLVIAGSGHTAILRDLLRADGMRLEEDVLPYL
jgi:hypothetical protein